MQKFQKDMFGKLPDRCRLDKENENCEALANAPFIFQVLKPCAFETLFHHNGCPFKILGKNSSLRKPAPASFVAVVILQKI